MKKVFSTIFILSLIFITSDLSAQKFKFGIKGGANYSSLTGDDVKNQDAIVSYHGGLFTRFTFSKIGVQAEALYSTQGADFKGNNVDLTYIHVPILLRGNFIAGKLGIYLGPQFGYLINAEYGTKLPGVDAKDRYKDLDISAVVGAEFDIVAGLLVGARYYQSLSTIGEDFETTTNTVNPIDGSQISTVVKTSGGDVKNQVFQLYLGYAF